MNRLTQLIDGVVAIAGIKYSERGIVQNALYKLGQYEDLGFEPWELQALNNAWITTKMCLQNLESTLLEKDKQIEQLNKTIAESEGK